MIAAGEKGVESTAVARSVPAYHQSIPPCHEARRWPERIARNTTVRPMTWFPAASEPRSIPCFQNNVMLIDGEGGAGGGGGGAGAVVS